MVKCCDGNDSGGIGELCGQLMARKVIKMMGRARKFDGDGDSEGESEGKALWIEALEMSFRMRDIAVAHISTRVGKVRRCSHTFEISLGKSWVARKIVEVFFGN
jgi:hypothetical protein